MRTFTVCGRWTAMLVLMLGFASLAHAQHTITLRLNAASIPDTITTDAFFEVRGAVNATGPTTLPDGNIIDWNDASTLEPTNIGGDYYEVSFQANEEDTLDFKFWSEDAEEIEINGGWEHGDNHRLVVGAADTTLPLHFFESTDAGLAYDWRPYEVKEDTVAVWFRVFMNTESATASAIGYDREDPNVEVGLRGDPLDTDSDGTGEGPLDWGATDVILAPESDNSDDPGYHIYSGVAYYPESLAGTTQPYKFYVEPSTNGWEGSIGDRTFTVPSQDTTLHWVYFDNSAPLEPTRERVTAEVIFTVDVTPLEEVEVFSRARGDTMIVRGDFNGFGNCLVGGNPDDCTLFEDPFTPGVFSNAIVVEEYPDDPHRYKFYGDFEFEDAPEGWEEPLDFGGGNREFVFTGENNQDLGTQYFNSIRPENVIPDGKSVEVTFQVDMSPAPDFAEKPAFDPSEHAVQVVFEDPVWIFTQTQNKGVVELEEIILEDDDGDMVYTGTFTVVGPTYNGIGYRYTWGVEGTETTEGSGGFDAGRRRYQYILPDDTGTFPDSYTLPTVTIIESGPTPFECNPTADVSTLPEAVTSLCYEAGTSPTGIEVVDNEIPSRISLDQNYPNPFNPATTFEYAIDQTQHVRIRVYDLTGRVVATLVDGVQSAATYRVTFSGADLASGLYVYQLETSTKIISKKMVLVK